MSQLHVHFFRELKIPVLANYRVRRRAGKSDEAEKAFPKEATGQGLTGLKGHRNVESIRGEHLLGPDSRLHSEVGLKLGGDFLMHL